MRYCKNSVETILLLGVFFFFGAYGLFAAGTPLCGDIGGPAGDGTPDGKVDFMDFAVLANEWLESSLEPNLLKADLNGDGSVSLVDFAIMSIGWLKIDDSPVDLLEDANFSRDSIAFLDGNEYAPGTQRFTTLAVSNVSDCIIHGAENVLGRSPVILAPKCSAGGYIYAASVYDYNNVSYYYNIYRSADGNNWERTTSLLVDVYQIFGTQSGAILVAKADSSNMNIYRSTVGGQDLKEYNLPPPVLVLPAEASVATWNFHQSQNGTICLSEYGRPTTFKKSRIYRSTDDGSSFTQVYDEPDLVYHSHRIMKHEATGRWVNVYGDGAYNKVVMSDDDGLTWSTLDPQYDNHFQPTELYDYGDSTNLLYGSDSSDFIGTFDVITRKITPIYNDGDRYNPYVFAIFYYNGVYYAGTFNGSSTLANNSRSAILASSDLVHWSVYHQFRNGEAGINKFLGVWGGRIHGIVTLGNKCTSRHFSFTPATVSSVQAMCLDPATENMLNTPQDSSVEYDISHWYAYAGGVLTRITTDSLHGEACLRVVGNSGIETVYTLSKPVNVGSSYSGRIWLKANGMNVVGYAYWYISGTSRYGPNNYFCLSQNNWTEIVLPPVAINAGENAITILVSPRSSNWPGPYNFLVDAAQYEAGPPSRWQVGGTPRANETLSKSVSVKECWTNLLTWAPECRSEWYNGFGNQYIKTWYRDPNNYLELYFDPCDSVFALQATVDGIPQTPINTSGQYKFYRNGVVRSAIRCDEGSLTLSVAAASAYEHVSGPPIDFLRFGTLINQTGNHSGTSMISHTVLSDVLYPIKLPDDRLN